MAVDEDDGQIVRELVPVDEAFMKKNEDEEELGATLGLEQKGKEKVDTCCVLKTMHKKIQRYIDIFSQPCQQHTH